MCYCGVVCCVCVCVCLRGWDIIADGGKIDNDSCIRACRRYNDWNTINQDLITRCHIMYIESGNIKYTPMLALTQFWPRVHRARNAICLHDDVIKWKHFPRYWPFVRGIHRSPVNSHHKGQVTRSFDVFFDLCLNKRLYNPSRHWWFETPSRPLCRLCNVGKSGIGCWHVTMVDTILFAQCRNTRKFRDISWYFGSISSDVILCKIAKSSEVRNISRKYF